MIHSSEMASMNGAVAREENGWLLMDAPAKSDFFQDPLGKLSNDSAPYLYILAQGDFAARVRVKPDHGDTYNATALMVWADPTHWAKLCYEKTDFDTRAVVSVVTNGISDDANGVDVDVESLWLRVVRKGQLFGMQYSLDGVTYHMVRIFHLPAAEEIRVGLVAQSPIGKGCQHAFQDFSLQHVTVTDVRAGT